MNAIRLRAWPLLPVMILCNAMAQSAPQPPCGTEPVPPYPQVTQSPAVMFLNSSTPGAVDWKPPACTGWTTPGFSTLVVTAARFHAPSGTPGLLAHIGAISELAGTRYWSTTHQHWQTLIVEAHALTGPQPNQRRNDFTAKELVEGGVYYFEQEDNLTGRAVYRLRLREVSENRIVFDVENTSPIRYVLLTIFRPADLQTVYFLDRDTQDVWRYYSLVRTGKNASGLATGKQASSINRAVAMFRRFAGLPTDLEPPAAR